MMSGELQKEREGERRLEQIPKENQQELERGPAASKISQDLSDHFIIPGPLSTPGDLALVSFFWHQQDPNHNTAPIPGVSTCFAAITKAKIIINLYNDDRQRALFKEEIEGPE